MADPMTTIDTSPEALERLAEELITCSREPSKWGAWMNCSARTYYVLHAIAAEKRLPESLRAADGSVSRPRDPVRVILSAPVSQQMELAAFEAWLASAGSSANERMAAAIRAAMREYSKELGVE